LHIFKIFVISLIILYLIDFFHEQSLYLYTFIMSLCQVLVMNIQRQPDSSSILYIHSYKRPNSIIVTPKLNI